MYTIILGPTYQNVRLSLTGNLWLKESQKILQPLQKQGRIIADNLQENRFSIERFCGARSFGNDLQLAIIEWIFLRSGVVVLPCVVWAFYACASNKVVKIHC